MFALGFVLLLDLLNLLALTDFNLAINFCLLVISPALDRPRRSVTLENKEVDCLGRIEFIFDELRLRDCLDE